MTSLYLQWRDEQRVREVIASLHRRRAAHDPRAGEGSFWRISRVWLGVV